MRYFTLLFLALFASQWTLTAQRPAATAKLKAIIEADSTFQHQEFYSSGRHFPSMTLADFQRRVAYYSKQLEQLREISPGDLSSEERINWEMLVFVLEDRIAEIDFESYLVPLNAEGGWYTDFLLGTSRVQKTPDGYDRYLRRMEEFFDYAREQIALMRLGLQKGRTAPQIILIGREDVVDDCLVGDPVQSPFFKPFLDMPSGIPPATQDSLRKRALHIIAQRVSPAYRLFATFWKEEYIPGAVREIGISAQPNGRAYYEQRIRYFTTLEMSPEEVFETGVKEVARIRREMEEIIAETGFEGSFQEFLNFLRTDARFYCTSAEQLLKEASFIAKKIDGKLPVYFGKLPRNSYGVSPVPDVLAPTYTGGRYSPGSLTQGRSGQYWVNTYNLPARPLYVLPSLTLHEAVPGHHLQISLAQELEGLPALRRQTYLSAFGEGWALYTEWLGEEMGIYTTPYERVGKLTYEMWRACRLVVDPGMHAKGWTRQQAIDFLVSNTALSLHECTTEIDRYIGWPGQAVSYKIGELKIRELRKLAEEYPGNCFDIRAFHDLVLSNGSVPLFTLERTVREWLEDRCAK